MTEHRWSKFWWQDYEADDALRVVSLAAQGLWMRMLCAMHKGTPYGHLTINGKAPTMREIASLVSTTEGKLKKLMQELEIRHVFSVNKTGVIFCRRMVRDKEISERGQQDGKRGGNPALKPNNEEGLTPPVKGGGYTLEAEAEAERKKEEPLSLRDQPPTLDAPRAASPTPFVRGCRIPDDWMPADPEFAGRHGVDQSAALVEFRDYWRGVAGKAGVKLDWEATWRNQVRHIAAKPKKSGYPLKTSQMPVPEQNAELMRIMDRLRGTDDELPHHQLRIVQ